jgi:hypothetical protein
MRLQFAARRVLAPTLASALILAVPNAFAEASLVRVPITFTLTTACPNLQVTVTGTGESFTVVNHRVDRNGVDHINMNSLATGTAVDSEGVTYGFNYHQHSSFEVPASGFPFSGQATDHFNLLGKGKANNLHVGFVLRATFTSPSAPPIVEFVSMRGNPALCDPI